MNRALLSELVDWKTSRNRKPLLLRGARQVGKTWLLKEFGNRHFKNCAYIRFDKALALKEIFEREHDVARLLDSIQLEVGFKPLPEETLIVFDEIQEAPGAISSLKYFCEDAPEYVIAGAGSQLGISDMKGIGFPVGKVDTLYLYPLSFLEFIDAVAPEGYGEMLRNGDWNLICAYRDFFTSCLKHYFYIGGMPEVVGDYAESRDFAQARKIQLNLLQNYRDDFGKHAPPEEVRKIEMIWDSIPRQLAKENKKFMYKDVQSRMKSQDLLVAMQWLLGAGLIRHTNKVSKPDIPLEGYADGGFKAFMLDVGLLAARVDISMKILLEKSKVFEEFKGALTEQFVQQELIAYFGGRSYYWSSDKSHNEIDFLMQCNSAVMPIEAKAGVNVKAKSLKAYCEKFKPPMAIRASLVDYYRQSLNYSNDTGSYELLDIPLYALCRLEKEMAQI